jgi:CHAT domain-containing protein
MIYGDYYIARDSLLQALEKYQKGLQYFDANLDNEFGNNPNISLVSEGTLTLQVLDEKAETLITLYHKSGDKSYLIDGISTYNAAIDLIDKMKSDFITEGSKYSVNEIASSILPKALEANYLRYEIEKSESSLNSIFSIIEKNKAEILFQNISSKYNLLASSLPKELIEEGIGLKYDISYYSKLLSEESQKPEANETNISKYKDKLFKLNEAHSFYDQKIKEEYPDFYTFKNEIGKQISINDLKSILEKDQLIIEYFQTKKHLYTISISKQKAEISKSSIDAIKPNVNSYFKQISTRPTSGNFNINEFNVLSYALANQLVLQDKNYHPNLSKIIFIPDGILNKIPFESLVIDESGKMLIESCNVTYNYSASQYLENHASPTLENPKVLCLTPSFDGYTSEQRNCNATILGDLPNIKKEFDYLKSNFSGSFFEDDLANSTNLTENFEAFPIIHLATHACLNTDDPMLSQIYFSDGALTTYDIQNLNSRPELVVLSACNTASGLIQDGEGVIGLSRGFFEAGVKGLQSSLWSIDDYSSSEIVNKMYHHLQRGTSKSEALRLSKLDYLKNADKLRSHPYYWAALIHIGNDTPMHFTNYNLLYSILILLLVVVCIVGFYVYKKKG